MAMATVLNYNDTLTVLNINRPILHSSQVIFSNVFFFILCRRSSSVRSLYGS